MHSDFPRKDIIDGLKKKGWLKNKTKVKICDNYFLSDNSWYVDLQESFLARHYWLFLLLYWLDYSLFMTKIIPFWTLGLFALLWLSAMIDYALRGKRNTCPGIGIMEKSEIFEQFLDKFGRGWNVKIAGMSRKIFLTIFPFLKSIVNSREWLIEYDILVRAFEWYKKDPGNFQQEFVKAKNKEELRWILGVN